MYSLKLSESGRILSATYPQYGPEGTVVDSLPDGDISDYKYIDGHYVYEPLPKPAEQDPKPSQEQRIAELEARMDALTAGYKEGVQQA